ncbi:MAG: 3-oxoacyl-ACP reductase FabG [Christensenellaceae bacterium]|jgi:3-oxoacyl-[acyl-carrier protein] reductase|nr:3-oxoacyl-ACP reductase FabG [Christensenellaceae bacterium]
MTQTNKVALITGGAKGIGKAITLKLASLGYDVIINFYTSKKPAEDLQKYIESNFKVKAQILCADIKDEAQIKTMIGEAILEFGKIDVLVNNAAIAIDKPFLEHTAEDFNKTLQTNLVGAFLVTKYAAPYMLKNKYGKIINISSNNACGFNDPVSVDYDCSKAGLNILTKNMAREFAPFVNVNAIAPGWIDTDMNSGFPPEFWEMEKKRISKSRIGKPEDVAGLVAFLISNEAEYINGEIVAIDGGMF